MRIIDLKVHALSVERHHQTVIAAPGRTIPPQDAPPTRSHFLLLEVHTDDEIVGFGELSDIEISRVDQEEVLAKLSAVLLDQDPFHLEHLMERLAGDPLLASAADSALYDLQGKALGIPVYNLMGGCYRDQVLVSWVFFIRHPELIAQEAEEMVRRGFRAFKLKVGLDIDHDEECVRIVREIAGSGALIKLDASGAWSVEDAIANIRRLERYDLQGVETPTDRRDIAGMARMRRSVGVPIIEHADIFQSLGYALDLVRQEAVDVFNVSVVGSGICRTKRFLALAEAAELECLLGSTVEMGVGTAAQLHLAASSPVVTFPSDLVGPAMYVDDYIERPFRYEPGGYLRVPTGLGLGVEVSQAQLAALA